VVLKEPAIPVTTPVELTEAIVGAADDHTPPPAGQVKLMDCPLQTDVGPEMDGGAPTLRLAVTTQPEVSTLVITALPFETEVTTPVTESICATEVSELLQVPVPPVFKRVTLPPRQTFNEPAIEEIFTVTLSAGPQQPEVDNALK
jgi:hypothetical protein